MNHDSLNNSALFGVCIFCDSSIYGLTVTRDIIVIPRAAIKELNARAFTVGQRFWRFGVHVSSFLGGFSVYWWGLRRSILVGTFWILSNRPVYVIT